MRRILLCLLAAAGLAFTLAAQPAALQHFDGKTWWAYIKILADDNMEGRETGSEGLRKAQAYIVEQLNRNGLQPMGTDGFYQHLRFVSRQLVEKDSSLVLMRDGAEQSLTLGEDAYFNARIDLAPEAAGRLVFVGYGLKIPERDHDDLAGVDLKGKIAVLLSGSPADIPAALASHYQTPGERWKAFREAGAIGIIGIPNPVSMDIPWSRMSLNRTQPQMELADSEFHETEGEKIGLTFNPANAEKLFAGSGHTFREIADLGKDRKPLPHFPLQVSIRARVHTEAHTVESANVVAQLPGSDAKLRNEVVVLSAHVDHVGIGEAVNGDRIYNGAMDNGSGCAVLLDVAASLKQHPEKLRRSILFVFVTAEEKGLLGSKYFTAHPTVAVDSLVADINVDMFLPIFPLKVLRVLGLTDSDLGDRATEVAQSFGVRVQPDPQPLRNSFVRSDQYNFIRHGVPSLIMDVGFDPGTPEQKAFKDWLTERYHAPSDDIHQPVDLSAAALYEEIVRQLLLEIANDNGPPQWKPDSFFKRYAAAAGK